MSYNSISIGLSIEVNEHNVDTVMAAIGRLLRTTGTEQVVASATTQGEAPGATQASVVTTPAPSNTNSITCIRCGTTGGNLHYRKRDVPNAPPVRYQVGTKQGYPDNSVVCATCWGYVTGLATSEQSLRANNIKYAKKREAEILAAEREAARLMSLAEPCVICGTMEGTIAKGDSKPARYNAIRYGLPGGVLCASCRGKKRVELGEMPQRNGCLWVKKTEVVTPVATTEPAFKLIKKETVVKEAERVVYRSDLVGRTVLVVD